MAVIKRALLSCYDKTGLDVFAKALAELGAELIASGGTAEFLVRHGLRVKRVEAFAEITEQLDGRVKTLHPKIHAGILAKRDDPTHVKAVGAEGLIDLGVVNLYPFERTIQPPGVSLAEAIEQIDIGGVALLRAAAKNFVSVAVISGLTQYGPVMDALRQGKGQLSEAMSRQLAAEAFQLTSAYDTAIASYLGSPHGTTLPTAASLTLRQRQPLRYGENPHQQGAWYLPAATPPWGLGTLHQLQGKELSYNNLLDIDAAFRSLLEFDEPACVLIKHTSQCGLALASTLLEAYERAYACDPESAFGGIVGLNRPMTETALAERLTSTFLEVIVVPSVDTRAAAILAKKPNLRVMTLEWPARPLSQVEWRQLMGSWAAQDADIRLLEAATLKVVTKRTPTTAERADLMFAWTAAKHVTSNGIVIARGGATVGIGQGQPSRVGSVRLAIEKAGERSRNAVAASDGFFPFPDSVELLAKAGVSAVIQPGGSIRDAEVIDAADTADMAMLFTGVRHFRH